VPNKSTIQCLVERFLKTGSIGEKRRSGRPSVLSNDSLEDIRARLLHSPRKSLRKLSQQTGMTYGSVQRAKKRLKLHPYRVLLSDWLRDFWNTL
jgi:transposase